MHYHPYGKPVYLTRSLFWLIFILGFAVGGEVGVLASRWQVTQPQPQPVEQKEKV
jgi:hypothetical protein